MTKQEKLETLADIFEVDSDEISETTDLGELAWDSMAMLSVIAVINEHFGKRIPGVELRSFKTIGDIMAVMTE